MTRSPLPRRSRLVATALAGLAVLLAAPALAATSESTAAGDALRAAVETSREAFDDAGADGAILARADEFADARAGSPLAEAVGGPLLLTQPDQLAPAAAAELQRAVRPGATVHLLGGTAALSPQIADAVAELGFPVQRHGGATRFDTAERIAHAVAGLREFAIEDVDVRRHPDEVVVQVTRPAGVGDGGLPATAWSLTEDGEPRPVRLAETGAEDLAVVLALDVAEGMGAAAMTAAREATTGFVNQLPAGASVGVVATTPDGAELIQAPSDDRAQVLDALQALQPGRGGALHDAVAVSLEALADAEVPAVVMLSDGAGADADLDATLGMVADGGVTLHVVELLTGDTDTRVLDELARAGGGRNVPAGDPAALAPLYDELAYDLVGPQRLVYASEAGGDAELTVAVDHRGVHEQASATVELPELPVAGVASPSFLTSTPALVVGAALVYAALVIAVLTLLAPRHRRAQLAGAHRAQRELTRGDHTPLAGVASRLVGMADDTLRRQGRRQAINQALERAGLPLRPGELVVLVACAAVAAFALGLLLAAWWLGLVLAGLAVLAAKVVVSVMGDRRQQRFTDQLSDTLQLLAGGLRSGYGLQQTIDVAAKESDAPTGEELSRVLVETRLGRDLMDALQAMADRMGSEDFDWVVQAIGIQREVGGDLAEVLDTVAATVRERARIRRQVRALSAEGRLSAWVLFALPFGVGGFILMTNPTYLAELTSSGLGYALIGIGSLLLLAGGLWLRRLVDLRY